MPRARAGPQNVMQIPTVTRSSSTWYGDAPGRQVDQRGGLGADHWAAGSLPGAQTTRSSKLRRRQGV